MVDMFRWLLLIIKTAIVLMMLYIIRKAMCIRPLVSRLLNYVCKQED